MDAVVLRSRARACRRAMTSGRVDMRDVAPTLAAALGLRLPQAEGRDLLGKAAR